MPSSKHFSVDEAQARLPELERIFILCAEIRAKAQARVERIQRLQARKDASPVELAIERSQVEFLAQCLEQALAGIPAMGAVLKGLDPGLVDFPHLLDGEGEVYLCWREGEKDIRHYHRTDEGFAGRRPLPDKQAIH
ncbi:MAG: DUF2203 domain-containing protein [Elusimicrobia bacterium]|nr:DUF2203 domain-containing protein [Elusimicrobiota bacterium]